jgi:hypothetical protein
MSEFKFADNVWHRVVQIVQEGMLGMGDVSDILRQIRVVPSEDDPNVLELSASYRQQVLEMHEKLLKQAREIQGQQVGNKFIVSGEPEKGPN